MMKRQIWVTGFGPFPGISYNFSAFLSRAVARNAARQWPTIEISHVPLDTNWHDAPAMLARLAEPETATLWLHFGVSRRTRGLDIERYARNRTANLPDIANQRPSSRRVAQSPNEILQTSFDTDAIARSLRRQGQMARTSLDAGRYVCNAVYFHSLMRARELPAHHCALFVHVPAHRFSPPDRWADTHHFEAAWRRDIRAGQLVLSCCLEQLGWIGAQPRWRQTRG